MYKQIVLPIVTLFLVATSGCTSLKADLVETGDVSLLLRAPDTVTFHFAKVHQENDLVTISAAIRHSNGPRYRLLPGHIDVTALDSAGQPIFSGGVTYRRYKSNSPEAHFSLSFVAPPNTVKTVILEYNPNSVEGQAGTETSSREDIKSVNSGT